MPYYHIRITSKSKPSKVEVEVDLSLEALRERFVYRYEQGLPIVIDGRTVPSEDIERIQINESEDDTTNLNQTLLQKQGSRNVFMAVDLHGKLPHRILADMGDDVTTKFITGPPGGDVGTTLEPSLAERPSAETREVFIVHGRNTAARGALFEFLRAIDLHPLAWTEAIAMTGKPSPYIGEILKAAFAHAHTVVILLTPDDEARLKKQFWSENEPPYETQFTGQARPNVLFEAGMAMAASHERTVLVELGNIRPFSDIAGLHAVRFKDTPESRQELAQRLELAGCPIKLENPDWLKAGDFEAALSLIDEKPPESTTDAVTQVPIDALPDFSEDECCILKEAVSGDDGEIIRLRHGSMLRVTTNNKHLCNTDNAREAAQWEQYLQELLQAGLIEDVHGDGKIFRVTSKGFEFADDLG